MFGFVFAFFISFVTLLMRQKSGGIVRNGKKVERSAAAETNGTVG
jgi:hypothetical protein